MFKQVLCAAVLVFTSSAVYAQTPPGWKETMTERAVRFGPTSVGPMLVQLKTGLFAVNPETGEHVWSRKDVTDYELVAGTPLAVMTTASGDTIADVGTGQDRWALASLGFTSIKGRVSLPATNLVLVYGQTKDSGHSLVAAEFTTGRVVWTHAKLFAEGPVASKATKVQYRDYVLDSDQSIVIDPSEDGLIRLDLQTGKLLWRLAEAALPSTGKRVTLYAAGDLVLADQDGRTFAVNRETGAIVWSRALQFPSAIAQVAATPEGLLVRGSHDVNSKGHVSWKPYLSLLNPLSGATVWTNEKTNFEGRSEFLLEGSTITVALKEGIASYDLASGRTLSSSVMEEFAGRETPCCLERTKDGRLRVWSSQNLRMFDGAGALVYSVYLKAPGASFMAKLATVALAVAASGASMAAAQPGGFYNVYSPGQGSALFSKFKATVDAERYVYVFAEEPGSSPDRFTLVRIDKATGEDTGRVRFTDRSPTFQVDPVTGVVLVADDGLLSALRFPARPPKGS